MKQDLFEGYYRTIHGVLAILSDDRPSPIDVLNEMGKLEDELPEEIYVMPVDLDALGYEEVNSHNIEDCNKPDYNIPKAIRTIYRRRRPDGRPVVRSICVDQRGPNYRRG